MDYFSHGSSYQLSLTPSSPDSIVDDLNQLNTRETFDVNSLQLPSIWDTRVSRSVDKTFHSAIPINETVIRISSARVATNCVHKNNSLDQFVLYERKKWQSQENFHLISFKNNRQEDTCFSEDDEIVTF